jgi:tungstate transport system ATP-binding protein
MNAPAYLLKNVRYQYPGASFVLDIDSLEIQPGKIIALVGPNGAGKTTLLMILGLLQQQDSGSMEFFGDHPWGGRQKILQSRREAVMVTHHPYLFKGTVWDNLVFGLKVRGVADGEWKSRVEEAMNMLELNGLEEKSAAGLSAGQAQRVALARAIILKPKVLLLDEPTANIDINLVNRVEAVINEVNAGLGTTIIFSTHNFSQAFRLAHEIMHFSDGKRVKYSHENYFSGSAQSDGKMSWIEPKPGLRITLDGNYSGHLTCVINPNKIEVLAIEPKAKLSDVNTFLGTVSGLEMAENGLALVRVSGGLNLRLNLPMQELDKKNVALSRQILVRFAPDAVEVVK